MDRAQLIQAAMGAYSPDLVKVDFSRIAQTNWTGGMFGPMQIDLPFHAPVESAKALEFLVAMGSLNYRFWSAPTAPEAALTRYEHLGQTGARALWSAFISHWGGSKAKFKKQFARKAVKGILGRIPDSRSRNAILSEILNGRDLERTCKELNERICSRGKVLVQDAAFLAESFPKAYSDRFLKKAQLALSMYAGFMSGQGIPIDVSDLVAFADYQVPRVLRAMEILRYNEEIARAVDTGSLIKSGSKAELAIRAATILACEGIAKHIGSSAADVDNVLWQSQSLAADSRFHLTKTTQY